MWQLRFSADDFPPKKISIFLVDFPMGVYLKWAGGCWFGNDCNPDAPSSPSIYHQISSTFWVFLNIGCRKIDGLESHSPYFNDRLGGIPVQGWVVYPVLGAWSSTIPHSSEFT
jgi:hypothetical protein